MSMGAYATTNVAKVSDQSVPPKMISGSYKSKKKLAETRDTAPAEAST